MNELRLQTTENVYATGEGILFKNFLPMAYSSNGKKSRSQKLLGLRWSYVRNSYRKSWRSLFNSQSLDRGVWVTDDFSNNYYHWFGAELPKLHLLSLTNTDAHILLPDYLSGRDYVAQSIEALGFNNVTYIKNGSSLKVNTLDAVVPIGVIGAQHTDLFAGLRNKLHKHIVPDYRGKREGKVYISRRSALKRRIDNEAEIVELVEGYGFQVVEMEHLSFRQQVCLMRDCKYVVAAHGAGLANMLFMAPRGRVLEFRSDNNPPTFIELATAIDIHHYSFPWKNTKSTISDHWGDMWIDVGKLDVALKSMVAAK